MVAAAPRASGMTTIPLDVLVDLACDHAKGVMVGKQGNLIPVILAFDRSGDVLVVDCRWANDEERGAIARAARHIMRERGVTAYSFVSEMWMAVPPPGWKPGDRLAERPKDRLDRMEGVVALATDGVNEAYGAWRTMRAEGGRCIELKPMPACRFTSPWAHLLAEGHA